jgi:hypothetical protein
MNKALKKGGWSIVRNSMLTLAILAAAAGCSTNSSKPLETSGPISSEVDKINLPSEKMGYWNVQRKGTNFMNSTSLPGNYQEAKEQGIAFIRLAPDKWGKERDYLFNDKPDNKPKEDFLIGSADQYAGMVEEDFARLEADLDAAEAKGVKVILTVLSLPGDRWRQFNGNKNDDRIWQDREYHKQSALFWKDLATRLKDHPAIVGYNLINEPHPETAAGFNDFWTQNYTEWYAKVENTAADLNVLYDEIVKAVRTVDKDTPIIVDSGLYATPWAFQYLKPIDDPNVLYAFHMYEPYEMTSQNNNKGFKYAYPGAVKVGNEQNEITFNRDALKQFLEPVTKWATDNKIPANRIMASEFGINRMVSGADQYMADLISIFDEQGWHWSFYAFREDTWDGMDYEMGSKKPDWKYWDARDKGELPVRNPSDSDNPIWNEIKNGLTK